MTADSETIIIPFELTDDDRREVRMRWLKRQGARVMPMVVLLVVIGAVTPGKFGGVFLGMGVYVLAIVGSMYGRLAKQFQMISTGLLAHQQLVVSGDQVSVQNAGGVCHLNTATVKKITEGNRLVFFETPWGAWNPIPRRVVQQQGLWTRVTEAAARPPALAANTDSMSWPPPSGHH